MGYQEVPALRAAVEDSSQGKTEQDFDKLDEFGVIREIENTGERCQVIGKQGRREIEVDRNGERRFLPWYSQVNFLYSKPKRSSFRVIRSESRRTSGLAEPGFVTTSCTG
jgi:hypothetical protein